MVAAADAAEQEGRLAEAIAIAEQLLAREPLHEHAHRRLMRLHYLRGDRAAALVAFDRCERVLKDELSTKPGEETLALLRQIEQSALSTLAITRPVPPTVLRPPRLIGREREWAQLQQAWEESRAVVIVADAGMGKTRLLSDLALARSGLLMVSARPGDENVPFAVLTRVVRGLLQRTTANLEPGVQRELARLLPELGDTEPLRTDADRGRFLNAVQALATQNVQQGLAGIALDDLHFADAASLLALPALVSVPQLRWFGAGRGAELSDEANALINAWRAASQVVEISLPPLTRDQLQLLLESLAIGLDTSALVDVLHRRTGGNPLFVLESVKAMLAPAGRSALAAEASSWPAPSNIGTLITRRISQLSPAAVKLARCAAIAGQDFSAALASDVLGVRTLDLTDAWVELEAAQVLCGGAFAHDLIYEAARASVPEPIALQLHGEVARWLRDHNGEPGRIASHFIAAGERQHAAPALHAAALGARHAMRRSEEAGFLNLAADIEASAGLRDAAFSSLQAMIEALWVVDHGQLDPGLFDRLDAHAVAPSERGTALELRARWARERGNTPEAKRLCLAAIALAQQTNDRAAEIVARQRLAAVMQLEGDFAGAVDQLLPLEPWVALNVDSAAHRYYGNLASALDYANRNREARRYHQRAIELARQGERHADLITHLADLAISWMTAGYMMPAITSLEEAQSLTAAHDEARGAGYLVPGLLYIALRDAGRYSDALKWIDLAEVSFESQGQAWLPLTRCHHACGWIYLGQYARAQREIDAALAAPAPPWMHAMAMQMRARIALVLKPPSARPWLEQARAGAPTEGRRTLRATILLDHALALPADEALAVAHEVIEMGERLDLPGTTLAGQIRATRFATEAGKTDLAAAHAQAALAFESDVAPCEMYHAELWLNACRAFKLAGNAAEAHNALRQGAEWVRATAAQVPDEFKDSFLNRNPINRELSMLARRRS